MKEKWELMGFEIEAKIEESRDRGFGWTKHYVPTHTLQRYLNIGWEPFAVSEGMIWLRLKKEIEE